MLNSVGQLISSSALESLVRVWSNPAFPGVWRVPRHSVERGVRRPGAVNASQRERVDFHASVGECGAESALSGVADRHGTSVLSAPRPAPRHATPRRTPAPRLVLLTRDHTVKEGCPVTGHLTLKRQGVLRQAFVFSSKAHAVMRLAALSRH